MTPSYPSDLDSGYDVFRTADRYGRTYLGLICSGLLFTNLTGAIQSFFQWAPLSPESTSNGCVMTDKAGLWNDVLCNWRASAVSCMVDDWTSITMTFPPRKTSNTIRCIAYDAADSLRIQDSAEDMTIFVDDALVYGLTLQLAVQPCMASKPR